MNRIRYRPPWSAWLLAFTLTAFVLAPFGQAQAFLAKRDNTTGTNAVVTFHGIKGRQVVLRHLDVTGDHADAVVQFASGRYRTTIPTTQAATNTTVEVASTNNFGSGQGLVLVQRQDNTVTAHHYSSATTGAIVITPALGTAAAGGDEIWWASTVGTNTIAAATVRLDGTVWAAQNGAPMAVRLYTSSGTAEKINSAVAEWVLATPR